MHPTVILFNTLALAFIVAGLIFLRRIMPKAIFSYSTTLGVVLVAFTFVGALLSPIDIFGKSQLLAWAVFVHCPFFLIGIVIVAYRKEQKSLAAICTVLTICIILIGLYAFLIEPHWLEVSRVTIQSEKLEIPVRVIVIADLQTDHPGDYEKHVFELVAAENPDLILLAGDYLHISDESDYIAAKEKLNIIFN